MTVNSKSYEFYHIGTKLKGVVNLDNLKEKMSELLKERGYSIPERVKSLITESLMLSPSAEIIGLKEQTKIQVNFIGNALNIIGDSPSRTLEVFEEVMLLLNTAGYDLDSVILFHEILTNAIIKIEENPEEKLNKIIKINSKTLNEMGYTVGVKGLRLNSETEDKKEIIDFLIEPNPLNPKETLILKILYRTQDRKKMKKFNSKIENIIDEIVNQLGV